MGQAGLSMLKTPGKRLFQSGVICRPLTSKTGASGRLPTLKKGVQRVRANCLVGGEVVGEAEVSAGAPGDAATFRTQAYAHFNEQRVVEPRAPDRGAVGLVGSWGEGLLLLAMAVSQVAWLVTLGYMAHRFVLSPALGY